MQILTSLETKLIFGGDNCLCYLPEWCSGSPTNTYKTSSENSCKADCCGFPELYYRYYRYENMTCKDCEVAVATSLHPLLGLTVSIMLALLLYEGTV